MEGEEIRKGERSNCSEAQHLSRRVETRKERKNPNKEVIIEEQRGNRERQKRKKHM